MVPTDLPISYSPSNTVRMVRQMAREMGVQEPVAVICVDIADDYFSTLAALLKKYGNYCIEQSPDYEDLQTKLIARAVDFCILEDTTPATGKIVALCQMVRTPVLLLDPQSVLDAQSSKSFGVMQFFNGKLNEVPVNWHSLEGTVQRAMRCCAIVH